MPEETERTESYDPSVPTREGEILASDDVVVARGTGRSGPHDIGTRPQDVPHTLGTDFGGPGSPTRRLWEEAEGVEPPPVERPPEADLPLPPDNPGGPPP
jgi:hypothetical protein